MAGAAFLDPHSRARPNNSVELQLCVYSKARPATTGRAARVVRFLVGSVSRLYIDGVGRLTLVVHQSRSSAVRQCGVRLKGAGASSPPREYVSWP